MESQWRDELAEIRQRAEQEKREITDEERSTILATLAGVPECEWKCVMAWLDPQAGADSPETG